MSAFSNPAQSSGSSLIKVPFTRSAAVDNTVIATSPSPSSVSNAAQPQAPPPPPTASTTTGLSHLPGAPTIPSNPTSVLEHITRELSTPILDELQPHLALFARADPSHIDPLCRQVVKGRKILATEDCGLHLVWTGEAIHVKPLPRYLLNHDVWTAFLVSDAPSPAQATAHALALGFLRSYAYLIRHEVDLRLARDNYLLPHLDREIEWDTLAPFLASFRDLPASLSDQVVAPRYRYGQLRMSRLNWAVRVFRPPSAQHAWFYDLPHWSTRSFLVAALAPLAFVFASLSLTLSAMSVALAVDGDATGRFGLSDRGRDEVGAVCWWFAMFVLGFNGLSWLLIFLVPAMVLEAQLMFSLRQVWRARAGRRKKGGTTALTASSKA